MCCCCKNSADFGILALRLSVALIFIYSGWMKLGNIEMIGGMLGGMGFFWPMFWAWVLALTEFVGGILVLVGVYTKTASALLAITMVVAILTAHLQGPLNAAFPAIAMLGATLALFGLGAGKYRLMKNMSECVCGAKSEEVKK